MLLEHEEGIHKVGEPHVSKRTTRRSAKQQTSMDDICPSWTFLNAPINIAERHRLAKVVD